MPDNYTCLLYLILFFLIVGSCFYVVVKVKSKVMGFWSFHFYGRLICFMDLLNLNFCKRKKVHNNFLMGLKIW